MKRSRIKVALSVLCFLLAVPFSALGWVFTVPGIMFTGIGEALLMLARLFDPPRN